MNNNSREYRAFKVLQHWKPARSIFDSEKISRSKLFSFLYRKTHDLYNTMPKRKNGEIAFIHPLNVALALKDANVLDEVTLCGGLIHDFVEAGVDIYKEKNNLDLLSHFQLEPRKDNHF